MQMPEQPAAKQSLEQDSRQNKDRASKRTFAVGAAKAEVAADVVKVHVRADDEVGQILLVDVVGDEVAIVRDARSRVDQDALVDAQDHVQKGILAIGVVLHD